LFSRHARVIQCSNTPPESIRATAISDEVVASSVSICLNAPATLYGKMILSRSAMCVINERDADHRHQGVFLLFLISPGNEARPACLVRSSDFAPPHVSEDIQTPLLTKGKC
jgi:hypothetical protein